MVYTDFRDELGESAELALAGIVVANDFERFRAKSSDVGAENPREPFPPTA